MTIVTLAGQSMSWVGMGILCYYTMWVFVLPVLPKEHYIHKYFLD